MGRKFSLRDFGAGTVLGLVIGTSGLAAAAMNYETWLKLSQDYKVGYVAGFIQMANLARNLEPGGYIDTRYPFVMAKPIEFSAKIDELYKDPEYQGYSINSMMMSAAHELEKKYGKITPEERMRRRMQSQVAAIQKIREAQAKKAGKTAPAPEKIVAAPAKTVPAAKKPPKVRKWCRCDGKDPKVERAKRRAVRSEAEKAAIAAGKDPVAAGKEAVAAMKAAEKKNPPAAAAASQPASPEKASPAVAPEPAKKAATTEPEKKPAASEPARKTAAPEAAKKPAAPAKP
jgi:hypothetical protein